MALSKEEIGEFATNLVDRYLERGVGGYSGRELELLVLNFVLSIKSEIREASIFEQSKLLKVSETRLKNMIYEINLKGINSDGEKRSKVNESQRFITSIEKNLKSATFEKGRFVLEIDDLFTLKKLKNILKNEGFTTDSSFNSDLVKVPYDGLLKVIDTVGIKNKSEMAKLKLNNSARGVVSSVSVSTSGVGVALDKESLVSFISSCRDLIVSKVDSNKSKQTTKS